VSNRERDEISLTPRFSGVIARSQKVENRFNGFPILARCEPLGKVGETVKTVPDPRPPAIAPLKRGVNENQANRRLSIAHRVAVRASRGL